jgi:hypothetical protein
MVVYTTTRSGLVVDGVGMDQRFEVGERAVGHDLNAAHTCFLQVK